MSDEQQRSEQELDRKAIIEALKARAKQGDTRAIDTLGRFKDLDWFARPEPARHEAPLSERTVQRIALLADRLLTSDVRIPLELARKLIKTLDHLSKEDRATAEIHEGDLATLRLSISDAEKCQSALMKRELVGPSVHQSWEPL